MKLINQIDTIQFLPIPTDIQSQLHDHLTLPFNSNVIDAQKHWDEYPTQLALIEPSDTDASIEAENPTIHRLIHEALITPEYVISISSGDSTYQLALLIVSDDGAGFYLLVSPSNTAFPMFHAS